MMRFLILMVWWIQFAVIMALNFTKFEVSLKESRSEGISSIYNNLLQTISGAGDGGSSTSVSYSLDLSSLHIRLLNPTTINNDALNQSVTWIPFAQGNYTVDCANQCYYTLNQYIYAMGISGYKQGMIIYDMSRNLFVEYGNTMLNLVVGACITSNDSHIFAFGGRTHNNAPYIYYSTTQIYKINNKNPGGVWSYGANMSVSRADAGCAITTESDRMFVFGGRNISALSICNVSNNALVVGNSIEEYNITNDSWNLLSVKLIQTRMNQYCFLNRDNNIYCIGGRTCNSISIDTSEMFNPYKSETFLNRASLIKPMYGFMPALYTTSVYKILFLLGGEDDNKNKNMFNYVQYYVVEENQTFLPTPNPTHSPTNSTHHHHKKDSWTIHIIWFDLTLNVIDIVLICIGFILIVLLIVFIVIYCRKQKKMDLIVVHEIHDESDEDQPEINVRRQTVSLNEQQHEGMADLHNDNTVYID